MASIPLAEVRVVATIPDLADIVREVGGDRVKVTAIAKGTENVHEVRIRPSQIIATDRADLFVQMGLSLEHAWVPGLLTAARNQDVSVGGKGFVNCGEGWEALDVPADASRKRGADLHPNGNPHFNLDPHSGPHMARKILEGLLRVDPDGREYYEANFATYSKALDVALKRWEKQRERLKGHKIVVYHTEFRYLTKFLGLEVLGTIEPKPGVPPTPSHLIKLIESLKDQRGFVIVTAAWSNNRQVAELSRRTSAPVVELPGMVGSAAGVDTWIGSMDVRINKLIAALEKE